MNEPKAKSMSKKYANAFGPHLHSWTLDKKVF